MSFVSRLAVRASNSAAGAAAPIASSSRAALRPRLSLPSTSQNTFSTFPPDLYATPTATPKTTTEKPSIALISKIRSRRPGTPLSLARSALVASGNDLEAALEWISAQAAESGAAKAQKLAGRTATEGLVGIAVLSDGSRGTGVRAAIVELSCETDFVARTDEFGELLEGIARSVAYFAEPPAGDADTSGGAGGGGESSGGNTLVALPPSSLGEIPLVPLPHQVAEPLPHSTTTLPTISTSIASLISRLGENISLRRASSIAINPVAKGYTTHFASTYLHGSKPIPGRDASFQSGTLAGLVVLQVPGKAGTEGVKPLARALARQVVAVPTVTVESSGGGGQEQGNEQSTVLYEQPLITMPSTEAFEFDSGTSVGKVLNLWSQKHGLGEEGVKVVDLARWEVGAAEAERSSEGVEGERSA